MPYLLTTVIRNIPLNTWTNFTIVQQGNAVDIYMNGLLEKSEVATSSFSIPHGNLYICDAEGYPGEFCFLTYFDRPLSPDEVRYNYDLYKEQIESCGRDKKHHVLQPCIPETPLNPSQTEIKANSQNLKNFLNIKNDV